MARTICDKRKNFEEYTLYLSHPCGFRYPYRFAQQAIPEQSKRANFLNAYLAGDPFC